MSNNGNGNGVPLLTDEERHEFYDKMREAALGEMAGDGAVLSGEDPYAADWTMDLEWPERCPDNLKAEVVSATYVMGKPNKRNGRVRESTLRKKVFSGADVKKMREAVGWEDMKEWGGQPDPFAYGNEGSAQGLGSGLNSYIPLWPGPVTRQLYWQDYWMMSAKSFEAYNHDPISWRCIHLKSEFALGRGLERKITYSSGSKKGQGYDKAQKIYEEFWKRNKMDARLDTMARDYCWGGETFLRYFKTGPKLTVRSLDPASIYDLITDPEDIETVFAYHQQFQTAYQLYPPKTGTPPTGVTAPTGASDPGQITKYIIRQILPQEVDHYKTNASAFERRGRSDLFPALGWIKRLRDYLTAHVVQADMLSRICWDLKVAGNQQAINKLQGLLFPGGRAPKPGTVFSHNSASTLEPIVPQHSSGGSSRGDPILDALVTMISLSGGVPKDWLGFGIQNTRAGALVATEPAAKSLQELQGTLEGIIDDSFNRVMAAAGINDAELETTFPSIAAEDRQQKLDDLGTMESNNWISKQTAATLAAKEMDITTYDFEDEQKLIALEFPEIEMEDNPDAPVDPLTGQKPKRPKQGDKKVRRPMLMATKRQSPKLDVTQSPTVEDDPAGLLVPTNGSTPSATGKAVMPAAGSSDGTGRTVPGGGAHENSDNPATNSGAKDIRKEGRNLREDETVFSFTKAELEWLLMRERRRRPDDQVFRSEADTYRRESEENLRELAGSVSEAGGPKRDSS